MGYKTSFDCKQLRGIPKRIIVGWIIWGLLTVYCLVQLVSPAYRALENIQECQISIDTIRVYDSRDANGRRIKLEISSENQRYYLWYPQGSYGKYSTQVKELLSGNVTLVNAKFIEKSTIYDLLLDKVRIVDLRTDDTIYYDLDTEKIALQKGYIGLWIVGPLFLTLWILSTIWILLIYRVMKILKK